MTVAYIEIGSTEKKFVHDVVSVRHISQHGYEISQFGMTTRLVIKDVESLTCAYRCLCHAARD